MSICVERSAEESIAAIGAATGLLGAGVSSASPDPRYCAEHPATGICSGTQGQPGNCGGDELQCWDVTGPPTPGEAAYINKARVYAVSASDTELLKVGRDVCISLINGGSTGYVVPEMAQHLGITNDQADQVMDVAMDYACPGLTIDAKGVARF